jgi:hypothetical protein
VYISHGSPIGVPYPELVGLGVAAGRALLLQQIELLLLGAHQSDRGCEYVCRDRQWLGVPGAALGGNLCPFGVRHLRTRPYTPRTNGKVEPLQNRPPMSRLQKAVV